MELKLIQNSILLDAGKQKVWDILTKDEYTKQWYAAFSEGSYAEPLDDWKEGSKVYFKDTKGCGMVATVVVNKPCDTLSLRHEAELKDGQEQPSNEETEKWQGALESYFIKEKDGKTELYAECQMLESYLEFMLPSWEKAMVIIKELAEAK